MSLDSDWHTFFGLHAATSLLAASLVKVYARPCQPLYYTDRSMTALLAVSKKSLSCSVLYCLGATIRLLVAYSTVHRTAILAGLACCNQFTVILLGCRVFGCGIMSQ